MTRWQDQANQPIVGVLPKIRGKPRGFSGLVMQRGAEHAEKEGMALRAVVSGSTALPDVPRRPQGHISILTARSADLGGLCVEWASRSHRHPPVMSVICLSSVCFAASRQRNLRARCRLHSRQRKGGRIRGRCPCSRPPALVLPANYRWARIDSALLTSKPPGASTARCVTLPSCAISA
jgi:hypothetical protein